MLNNQLSNKNISDVINWAEIMMRYMKIPGIWIWAICQDQLLS